MRLKSTTTPNLFSGDERAAERLAAKSGRGDRLVVGQIQNARFMAPFVIAYPDKLAHDLVVQAMRDAGLKSYSGWMVGGRRNGVKERPSMLEKAEDGTIGIGSDEGYQWAARRVARALIQMAGDIAALAHSNGI